MPKHTKAPESKQALIQRLLAKAALDFRCCGHGASAPAKPKK